MGLRTRTITDAERNEAEQALWNDRCGPDKSETGSEHYHAALLEQYKLYVEMADRVSQRRGLTNTFFLTLNTLIFTIIGVFWKDKPADTISDEVLIVLLGVALCQCAAWWLIVRSYRQLNSGKYVVVGLLEKKLPASPYWAAEWKVLGEGKDTSRYLPLTHVEQIVPIVFAAAYSVGFALAL